MDMIEGDNLIRKQNSLLETMPHEAIAHGASVRYAVVRRLCPKGLLLELGCGDAIKAHDYDGWYGWYGIDINQDAVDEARRLGYVAYKGDARNFFSSELGLGTIAMIENIDGVLLQGLLANMVTTGDIRSVLRTADIALRPGGWVFLAEPIRFDTARMDEALLRAEIGGHTMTEWQEMWTVRYQLNADAGLPPGVFAVAKPGPDKDALEWSLDPHVLQDLIHGPELERFARHVSWHSVDLYFRRLQMFPYFCKTDLMFSRSGSPLLGWEAAYRKEHGFHGQGGDIEEEERMEKFRYKYHPWYKGKTLAERAQMQEWRHMFEHDLGIEESMREFFRRFRKNVPTSQQPPRSLHF
jgi:hypothetical protein